MIDQVSKRIGIVAIGRNEGERLRSCLDSALRQSNKVVYVDSGSTDRSVELARSFGTAVVKLDMDQPFTAARARNAGIARLFDIDSQLEFVQVVDGDCEMVDGWIDSALQVMNSEHQVAVVCGRRRERFPQASVYNKLCDMEWNTPIGQAAGCGGDALIRLCALRQVGGYDSTIIAGEEPEMCLRLRLAGFVIRRIPHEMTLHDANMTTFGQWWRRTVRTGHAYAELRAMHGNKTTRLFVREVRSIVEWVLLLPLIALSLAWLTWGASLLLLGGYVLLWRRVRSHRREHGDSPQDASLYASYCVLGKFAELVGIGRYWWNRLRGKRTRLIEYKHDQRTEPCTPAMEVQKT